MNPAGAMYDLSQWTAFFATVAGAAAGLTGLLFVSVSINLRDVVASRNLVARVGKALFALVAALLVATVCLVPGQPRVVLGGEVLLMGVVLWVSTIVTLRGSLLNNEYVTRGHRISQTLLSHASAMPFVAAGISLMLGHGGGLYWLVAGMVFAFLAALADAWVLLIEIQR